MTVPQPLPTARTDGKAIGALICGILSVLFIPILGVVAIVLGVMSRNAIDRSDGAIQGRTMATAGMALGVVGLVLAVLYFTVFRN